LKFSTLGWLFAYRRAWLRADIVAGLTTAAVVIPQTMAYAAIAGLPVETGLYTALATMLVYPLLGSSRPLSVTTTSAIAMLTGAEIAAIASPANGVSAATAAATLALLVGGILLLARLFRLGFLADFISTPVLVGFKAGVGVVIIIGQLKSVLGVHVKGKTTVDTLLELPALVTQAHGPTLLVAAVGVALLVALPRVLVRAPASLVWVAMSIVAAPLIGFEALGIESVGSVPAGLPRMVLPDIALVSRLWPAALGIALMSFTESVAAARTFCKNADPPINANRELLAVGAANLASAWAGGLPAGGGSSQTAVADAAGAKSQLAQWINAAVLLITLLFLSRAIEWLTKPALGALILVTSFSMIKPESFRAIGRVRRDELMWAFATLAGVILIGTLQGILIAVAISILTLFYQAIHPPVYAMAYCREKDIFRRAGDHETDETFPGLLMLRTEGRLHFANAAHARAKMRALMAQVEPRVVILECGAILDIEYTALMTLTEAEQNLREHGVTLWLANVNPDLLAIIERSPLGAALGRERMFFSLRKAMEAWHGAQGRAAGSSASATSSM
jgi:high affinity sulfate transporter 1